MRLRPAPLAISLLVSLGLPAGDGPERALVRRATLRCEGDGPVLDCPPLDLKARELVQLAIHPRSPTRPLLLRGQGAEPLLEVESPDLPPDGLTFIAPADGRYRLQVGRPGHAPRLWEVPLLARRPAQPADDTRIAAQEAFGEGARWRRQDLSPSQEKAIERFDAASRAYAQLGDTQGEALALSARGACQLRLDQRPGALRTQEDALALLARAPPSDPSLEAEVRQNLGRAYLANDHAQEALLQLDRALTLARRGDDGLQQVGVLTDLGETYHAVSRFAPSLASFEEARERLRGWTEAHPEEPRLRDRAVILFGMGASHQQQQQVGPAFARFEEAVALYRAAGDRHGEARVLNRLGSLYGVRGDWGRGLEYCRRALALNRPHGYEGTEAYIHHNLGHGYAARREWPKALEHHQAALTIRRRIGNQTGTGASLVAIAWVHTMRGALETALPILEEARETVEEIRARLTDVEFRSSYFVATRTLYERYGDLLLQLHARHPDGGYLARAFEATEGTRARSLLDALGGSPGGRVARDDGRRLERTRLQEDLNRLAARYDRVMAGARDPEPIRALDEQIDYALSRRQMREAEAGAGGRTHPLVGQPLTLAQVQEEILDPDTVLLQYRLSSRQSLLFLVTRERILWFALPPAETIEPLGRRVYECLTARQRHERFEPLDEREARIALADRECEQAAARLSRMILGPAASHLGRKRLLVAADGILHSIPFAALPHPASIPPRTGRPLLLSHEVSYVPSVSILAGIRRELEHRRPAPRTILVMADPVFGVEDRRVRAGAASPPGASPAAPARLARLRNTGQEAATVARLVPPRLRHIASGFEATRALAGGPEASRCRIIHFATHALLNNAHPALSGILLSRVGPDGREQEGMLRAHEIVDLRLSADLVVLSSCSTGVGQARWGEGLLSLTGAFLRAGAARVVVSLWDVDDAATAELMSRFYENLLGPDSLGPTAALRAAQTAMLQDPRWAAPYYWAAFGIQGEYRPSPAPFQNSHAGAAAAVIQR